MPSPTASPIFHVGLDVHKDSVTAAVFRNRDPEPLQADRLPNDPERIRRYFERLTAAGRARACYEASGAGYVLQRALTEWGGKPSTGSTRSSTRSPRRSPGGAPRRPSLASSSASSGPSSRISTSPNSHMPTARRRSTPPER